MGLVEAASSFGVKIYQHSQVLNIEKNLGKYKIFTKNFAVTANKIVMATNGFYKDDLLPDFNDRILPAISNIIVTRPLTSDELASHNYSTNNPVLNSRPSIGKLENDGIYYSFGYQANGVNTAPWAGKELANLIAGLNSKKLQISNLYLGLPKKFPLPFLRIVYLRLAYLYYNFIDK